MRHQTCPAPDCPGNGDCVPSAKADTVAYEVAFKRGKMTFLSGDGLGNADIFCGDRVKMRVAASIYARSRAVSPRSVA